MSLFFKHFHKTPFWSQLFFGMVAMFALPEIQAVNPNECEQEAVINQSFQYAQATNELEQQSLFIAELNYHIVEIKPQAVNFCEFFTKSYRLDKQNIYPIRAGPYA